MHTADAAERVTSRELLAMLRAEASERHRLSVVRLGIPEADSIGVPIPVIRRIAKGVGRSNPLARELWATGVHEARLLAALVFDPATLALDEASGLLVDVRSWDLCDHLCNSLFLRIEGYGSRIPVWAAAEPTYTKRAAFALMASATTHERALSEETVGVYLDLIERHAGDPRLHVKKAVSWALREVGQRDLVSRDRAVEVAQRLVAAAEPPRVWVGRDALRDLERMRFVEGKRRLVVVRD
ncbi:DNA alkylation repair protein [Leucobacter sp. VD1]|uniref:DNA alkylation repair protein n=1 Tax=Leucobacter sp. VD1 TaxID=3080381 RepID=UPI00301A1E13